MIALFLGLCLAGADPGPTEQVSAGYTIKVAQRSDAMAAIIAETKRLGGWFASLSNDEQVSLRVPVEQVSGLQAFIEAQGLVAERNYATVDVRRELAELDARIESRRELLAQYLELLDSAGTDAVLRLEYEITNTIAQVEQLEGQRRLIRDQVSIARVDVGFRFRDRRRDQGAGPSPFEWINGLDVRRIEGDLRGTAATTSKRPRVGRPEIAGFATYRLKKEFRASSPDGVVVRTRAVKHKPRADIAFWAEAVQTHMMSHGYTLVRDEAVPGGRWLEWGIPVGEEDHTYVTLVRPRGRVLDLVEVAGVAETFEARREAIVTGLKVELAATAP